MGSYTVYHKDGYELIENQGGAVLGMAKARLKEADGFAFKDLSGVKELLPYEDWRLPPEKRAEDLAGRLSLEDIAGLMLFSPHQMVPFPADSHFVGHYHGGGYVEGETDPAAITDEQLDFVLNDRLRNVLLNHIESAQTAVRWNNRIQALAEEQRWGIPICISSDPRHSAGEKEAEFSGAGREVSRWPEGLGMAATFSPELMKSFAETVSKEYRALGISVALGPQIDLATEPRWMRYEDTWGGDAGLVTAMTKAYCDGLQTTPDAPDGWGGESVAAMVKHWPGGGTGEGGRDAHYVFGKYAVYPGGRFDEHMKPFTEGAFSLDGPTKQAAAVMPYYTISWGQDKKYKDNVGNSYSRYIISDLLRRGQKYNGVICTDWGITGEPSAQVEGFNRRCHGVENLSTVEQHLRILMNGVDMFGGNSKTKPVLDAYRLGCEQYGQDAMRRRFEESAVRILTMMFRLGLFENPYLDLKQSAATVGKPEFVEAGREAQRRSVVLLKNKSNVLPLKPGCRIYVPCRHVDGHRNFLRKWQEGGKIIPLTEEEVKSRFLWADTPEEADAAVVFVESPLSDGFSQSDMDRGGNGYLPITLQYRPYRADQARAVSIAGGDFRDRDGSRSYRGKENVPWNHGDLDCILETQKRMGGKPIIVCMHLHNPAVVSEFEPAADGILAHFGVEKQVLLDILSGKCVPGGRLPLKMPASMETVERHREDVFDDIECHTDECGNVYDFGFGLSLS